MADQSNSTLNPFWVTGFSDAESSFTINMRILDNTNNKITLTSTFKIALDKKDIDILYNLKTFFGTGNITIYKKEARFEIMGYEKALQFVIPHFDKYPLLTQKLADYLLWKDIILIQKDQLHLTKEGLIKCLNLKACLNKGLNNSLKLLLFKLQPYITSNTKPLIKCLNLIIEDLYYVVQY